MPVVFLITSRPVVFIYYSSPNSDVMNCQNLLTFVVSYTVFPVLITLLIVNSLSVLSDSIQIVIHQV